MWPEYKIPLPEKFKYEFNKECNLHIWYDDKILGTVFSSNAKHCTKEESFEWIKKEIAKMTSK